MMIMMNIKKGVVLRNNISKTVVPLNYMNLEEKKMKRLEARMHRRFESRRRLETIAQDNECQCCHSFRR